MSLKKIIITLLITIISGATLGYFAGYLMGKINPNYITRSFVPERYLGEDGTVRNSSYWGYPGVYRPEKLGAEIGLFQGTIVGFWLGVIYLAFNFWKLKIQVKINLSQRVTELEGKTEKQIE